jgi:RND superfamily putative drug exporter
MIMVAVFCSFAIAGSPQLKELGIGLAVAVGLDATVIRLIVVPATMRLLGDWNWWLPARLERVLPRLGEA